MPVNSPFSRVVPDHPESSIVLEAVFDLPNDGTPTRNQLVVRISLDDAAATHAEVALFSRTHRDRQLAASSCAISELGNLLYGCARVVNKPQLVVNS